jgi:hypothetical protein
MTPGPLSPLPPAPKRRGVARVAGIGTAALAAVAVLGLGIRAGLHEARADRAVGEVDSCRASDPLPFDDLPPELRVVGAAPEPRQQTFQSLAAETSLQRGLPPEALVSGQIVDSRGVRGYVFAYPGAGVLSNGLQDFAHRMSGSASAVTTRGCWAIAVVATTYADVSLLAGPFTGD